MAAEGVQGASAPIPAQDLNGPVNFMQKYDEERSKRSLDPNLRQYIDPNKTEKYKYFLEDPWIEAGTPIKNVVTDGGHSKFVIFGAGFGGILFAVHLIKAGFSVDDLLIVDPSGGFGGTWWWNRYPGLMCDVEAYIYMPLLEESGYQPKRKYASGEELREYCESVTKGYDLHKRAMFQCSGKTVKWNEEKNEWLVQIALKPKGGQESQIAISADFVIFASGVLNNAKLPDVPGFESYQGHQFHTARFDYRYTGGSQAEPALTNLQDKKVALVGTGATGVQLVPHLAKWSKELFVFQRTPSSIDVRGNYDTNPASWKSEVATGKGWWIKRNENFMAFLNNVDPKPEVNMVNDMWTKSPAISALLGGPKQVTMENVADHVTQLHATDLPRAERVRKRAKEVVEDPATAKSLQAWYPIWCKRPCFHDEYLQTFNQHNVHLIDTHGEGIETVTERGLQVGGKEYDFDVIIWGTGFISPGIGSAAGKAGIVVTGRDGADMEERSSSGDLSTLHGVCARDFPNMFWAGPLQAGVSANYTFVLDTLSRHVAYIVAESTQKAGVHKPVIEPTAEAQEAWALKIMANAAAFAAMLGCTPGYLNREGAIDKTPPEKQMKAARNGTWGYGMSSFLREIEGWRAQGDLAGFEVKAAV